MAKEIFSKNPHIFNSVLATELKKFPEITAPEWSFFVKTGVFRQRVPESPDFWHIRTASILRQIYINGVVGVERLRTRYGGRKDRGARPSKFAKASGKMIRLMLQQAEAAGLLEKVTNQQFGRRLTQKGRDLLDSIKVPEADNTLLRDYIAKTKVPESQEEIVIEGDEEDEE